MDAYSQPQPDGALTEAEARALAVHQLREIQETMMPEERVDFWRDLQAGFCIHCGEKRHPCYCQHDD